MNRSRTRTRRLLLAAALLLAPILVSSTAAAGPVLTPSAVVFQAAEAATTPPPTLPPDLPRWLRELLPESFVSLGFLDVQLWQWIGMLLVVVGGYALAWLVTWIAYALLARLTARTETTLDDQILRLTRRPVRFLVGIGFISAGMLLLHLVTPVQTFMKGLFEALVVVAIAWIALRLVDLAGVVLRARFMREGRTAAMAVIPLGTKSLKVVVLGLALVTMMAQLGFNVTGLIAGLGVGGLAVALAAQKTVENLFGGISLILDQPVRVGDACRFGNTSGTIEDIGLRSTRIRTADRTVVSVPNAEFAYLALENIARRDKIKFQTTLGLRYETTADQLRFVLAELRKLLLAHPRVDPSPARVRFVGYGASSLDLEILAFLTTQDGEEFLAIQEDLLLRIMDVVEQAGTGFAFPSSTTYLARDRANDAGRTRRAEEHVAHLREEGKLPFPDFAPEIVAEIDDTLEYPPPGSAVSGRR